MFARVNWFQCHGSAPNDSQRSRHFQGRTTDQAIDLV
jgi:hypothetical protein